MLAGLGMLAIPGIGPVVAARWLVSTVVGAVVGAAGSLVGSLIQAGVSESDAHVYAETRGADYRASGWTSFDPEAASQTFERPSEQREAIPARR